MGAMVTIRYVKEVTDEEATTLGNALQTVVAKAIEEKDVFIYADKTLIVVGADPIEVFVQVNAQKVSDPAALMTKISEDLAVWKTQNNFAHPINLNVMPVEWHAKFGV
jgi:hypothetical protein